MRRNFKELLKIRLLRCCGLIEVILQHREQFVVRHKQLLSDQVLVIATVYTLVALPLVTVTVRVLALAVGVMLPPLATFFPP